MTRADVHRPSAINTEEYEYVGENYIPIFSPGDCQALIEMRLRIQEHMTRTGGHYSSHEHGGSCGICGNVNALYTVVFYHTPSNTYIITGRDCADKLGYEDNGAFRKAMKHYLEYQTGKQRAFGILAEMEAGSAWAAFEKPINDRSRDENTMADIVGKLIQYGHFYSEKQKNFLVMLVERNGEAARADRQLQWAAEKEAAAPCPTGRVIVTGVVVKTKDEVTQFGPRVKMTVKDETGYMVYVTAPSAFMIEKGDKVIFTATLTPSPDDPKFGFGKRPSMIAHNPEPNSFS